MPPGAAPTVGRTGAFAVGALVTALIAALVAVPLLRLGASRGPEGADVAGILGSPGVAAAVRNTVVLAAAVTVSAVPIGVALALVLRQPDLPGRTFWRIAVLLPVLVPDFVLGYSWTQAYARAGFTDAVLGVHWAGLLGPVGVWLVLVVNAAPLVYLVVAVGLAARAEPDLERAARVSGAGGATALLTITLRLALPAVMAAAVLVFVLTLGTFAIPQVLGAAAGFDTVTTRIYADLSIGGDPASFLEAVTLALLLVLVAGVCVAPADTLLGPRLGRRGRPTRRGRRHPRGGGRSGGLRPGAGRVPRPHHGAAAGGPRAVVDHPRPGCAPDAGQLEPRPLPPGAHAPHR